MRHKSKWKFGKLDPKLIFYIRPVGGLQNWFMLGWLAILKTLEIKGRFIT